jgi:hypothetical protein
MRVQIPFRPEFEHALRNGNKTMTTRSREMGLIGDTFEAFGCIFTIDVVRRVKLGVVAASYWRQEGCESSDAFIAVWNTIHPRKKFDPEGVFWLHEFHMSGQEV